MMTMDTNVLIQIGTIVIALIGAIITYIVVPYIKSKTTKEQRNNVMFWVDVAVTAAEQIYNEKGQGKLKKKYVLEFLNSMGLDFDEKELNILIEAVVLELNRAKEDNYDNI